MSNYQQRERRNFIPTNDLIRANWVHIVDDGSGQDIGRMSRYDALQIARESGKDLMQISFNAGTAICKICDYGKYMYEQKRRAKEAKKRAKENVQEVKEISFSIRIDEGDKKTKLRHIQEFLADNCKVRLCIQFSRREMSMLDYGKDLMKSLLTELTGLFIIDIPPKAENQTLSCTIKPMPKKK